MNRSDKLFILLDFLIVSSGEIVQDQIDGKPRVVKYIPYLGNYGYIPNTHMAEEHGGDGDALDVLLLCEALPIGTELDIIPIGVLSLLDDGERDDKVIAIPADISLRTINAETLKEFSLQCVQCKEIIQLWFKNYNPKDSADILGWKDEIQAMEVIEQCLVK